MNAPLDLETLRTWQAQNPAHAYVAMQDAVRGLYASARRNIHTFAEVVGRDEETNRPITQAEVHYRLHRAAAAHKRVVAWAHIEAGKTSQMSILRPLYLLGRNPNLRIAVVSSTAKLAQRCAEAVRNYIDNSEELHEVFPDLVRGKKWGDTVFTVKRTSFAKEPSFQALGMNTAVLGARLDLIVLDDVLTWEMARNPEARERALAWYKANVAGRITDRGQIVVVNTPMHPEDLPHMLAKTPGWASVKCSVIDAHGQPTWPERWPLRRIREKELELGPLEAGRQLFVTPISDEDARFQAAWIRACLARGVGRAMPQRLHSLPAGYRTFTGVDLGTREDKKSDLTVLFTIMLHPDGSREVLCVESGRWLGPEIVRRVIETHQRYHSIILVESNAAQDYIRQFVNERAAIPIKPFNTGRNKADPIFGLESMGVEMFNAKWIIPNANGTITQEVGAWIQEMTLYRPDAHTGDRLMASWFAREGARRVRKPIKSGRS